MSLVEPASRLRSPGAAAHRSMSGRFRKPGRAGYDALASSGDSRAKEHPLSESLRFKLSGKIFAIVDPQVRFGSLNAMALVSKLQSERPASVAIEFDGSEAAEAFIAEVVGDAGYTSSVEGTLATVTPG